MDSYQSSLYNLVIQLELNLTDDYAPVYDEQFQDRLSYDDKATLNGLRTDALVLMGKIMKFIDGIDWE